MNEDEAFIRAIVDAPGDDHTRLVYADWLDDRADPRGTYLREEVEWAKLSPRSRKRKPAEKKLRTLAKKADPVWIARVSRPPIGVCCDHLRFCSPRGYAPDEIAELERELKYTLPPQYRAFLLDWFGQVETPEHIDRDEGCPYPQFLHPQYYGPPIFRSDSHRFAAFCNPDCWPDEVYEREIVLLVGLTAAVADHIYWCSFPDDLQREVSEGETLIKPLDETSDSGTIANYLWTLPAYEVCK
jgi:uncharacterized protein (TIGR02996 family)